MIKENAYIEYKRKGRTSHPVRFCCFLNALTSSRTRHIPDWEDIRQYG